MLTSGPSSQPLGTCASPGLSQNAVSSSQPVFLPLTIQHPVSQESHTASGFCYIASMDRLLGNRNLGHIYLAVNPGTCFLAV